MMQEMVSISCVKRRDPHVPADQNITEISLLKSRIKQLQHDVYKVRKAPVSVDWYTGQWWSKFPLKCEKYTWISHERFIENVANIFDSSSWQSLRCNSKYANLSPTNNGKITFAIISQLWFVDLPYRDYDEGRFILDLCNQRNYVCWLYWPELKQFDDEIWACYL